jgi:hypothetical protein
MSKVEGNVFFHEQGVTYYLIIGYTASGAKLAGMHHRRLYGTREVIVALRNGNRKRSCKGWHETVAADWPVVVMKPL